MGPLLLLIDIQMDYFPGGAMELHKSTEASMNAGKLLALFRSKGQPVVHVRHVSDYPGATFFRPETPGIEIHDNVKPLADELVMTKRFPNAFRGTSLLDHIKDIGAKKLVICGMMTHMCVDSTTRAAFDHGFSSVLVTDACATRELAYGGINIPAEQVHAAFVAALCPLFAKPIRTDEYIAAAEGGKW